METGAFTQRIPRRLLTHRVARVREARGVWWATVAGLGLAAAIGVLAGGGSWMLAVVLVVVPAFLLLAMAAPERTTLALIAALPFFIYPATVGGFSLFIAIPTFGFVSIVLLSRSRASLGRLRRDLPALAFAVLLAAAVVAAMLSSDPTTAFSRVTYLVLFGLFAFSLATALAAGRLSREAVAKALLVGGALAGAAIVIQFVAQFGAGKNTVLNWLFDVEAVFAGENAAAVRKSNWVVEDLDVVRGVFPFMSPPSAGGFLMFSLLAGVWLRQGRKAATGAGSALETALLVLVAAALLFTFSRQAWLGAAIGVAALGLGRRPLWMLAIAVQLVLVVSFVPIPGGGGSFADYLLKAGDTSTQSTDTRLELWEQTIDLIPEHAVIGAGPGLVETLGPGNSDRPFYAHNVFLDGAVELGIAGALALLAVFIAGLRAAYRRGARLAFALLAAYVVAGVFDDVLYLPRNGLVLAVAFALIVGSAARRPRATPPRTPRSSPRTPEAHPRGAEADRTPAQSREPIPAGP
jgi:O-antigen ligase